MRRLRQYSLLSLFSMMAISAVIFGVLHYFRQPLYETFTDGLWFESPLLLFNSLDDLRLFIGAIGIAVIACFAIMIYQLSSRGMRPYSVFFYLAYSICWWGWAIYTDLDERGLRPFLFVLFLLHVVCVFEVLYRRIWRQHWAVVAYTFLYLVFTWLFSAVSHNLP